MIRCNEVHEQVGAGMWLLAVFIVVPLIEIGLFIKVGGLIGLWPTMALIIALALLGAWLVRSQGALALAEMQTALQAGQNPSGALVHGAMIFFAGLLLMVPGFFTDVIGLLLLIRPIRALAIAVLAGRFGQIVTTFPQAGPSARPAGRGATRPDGADVIDGSFTDMDQQPRDDATGGAKLKPPSGWTRH